MSIFFFLYTVVLFFVLTPSILLRLPTKGSKYTVAGVHALVFGLVLFISHKLFRRFRLEGFEENITASELPAGSQVLTIGGTTTAPANTTTKPANTTTKPANTTTTTNKIR